MSEWIPVLVMALSEWPARSKGLTVSAGRAAAWRRRPAPPSVPAVGSEPLENPVWAGPAGPAAPQLAARDSARSVGCYQPSNAETGEVTLWCSGTGPLAYAHIWSGVAINEKDLIQCVGVKAADVQLRDHLSNKQANITPQISELTFHQTCISQTFGHLGAAEQ